jgi:transposase
MEDWVTIKTLKAKNPAMSYREIAELLNISHHTVKAALERTEPPAYKRKSAAHPYLDPFREVIQEMFLVQHFRGSRIFEEIKSKGYEGGRTALYMFLAQFKVDTGRTFTPYETAPGEQSQFDWSPYSVLVGGVLTRIIVYSYINSFSRFVIFDAALSENQGAVFEAFENGIIASGGVPRRAQVDNAKVFVLNASHTNFQWNPHFLHLCGHYGFEPSRSLPAHPWSKGKVEKPFAFLETHFIAGASFADFPDLVAKLKDFQGKVNARPHATIKVTPEELIGKDRENFSPLPATRYIGVKEETRKVTSDCLLSYDGSRYSAPWLFAGKHVWVRVSKGFFLEIYSQANAVIACHKLSPVRGALVIDKAHYRMPVSIVATTEQLSRRFRESFPDHELYLQKLQAQKRFNARYHLHQILELAKLYHKEDVVAALRLSVIYNVFSVSFLAGYLEKHCTQSFDLQPLTQRRSALPPLSAVGVHLSDYRLDGGRDADSTDEHSGDPSTGAAAARDPQQATSHA